ncbi:SDR family oxidoreductase [Jiella mangrovi]|uniref:SDR family oxidoreductase n=1 Tax=Jiella mangrovi TaxID=2821407 RepID=A0ABS4BJN1_9HYPH|nr:SDR family oxidoreductase [Jiella mangrovi]MBP0616982.1 SDR family oxidoreductase [Jiella mangrovi]
MSKIPPQTQNRLPGLESELTPPAEHIAPTYRGTAKLAGKVAIVTGGDSGIGRAVAIHFAREGAKIALLYLDEHEDARNAERLIAAEGAECLSIAGDIADSAFCTDAVGKVVERFGGIDILVNNAGTQIVADDLTAISDADWRLQFGANIDGMFYLSRAARPHLKSGARIINTSSINGFAGNARLVAYSATKGAIAGFTRALAKQLAPAGILVNEVAPGPIWTPIQPASFDGETVAGMGEETPLGRIGQPSEVAPAYVYLASADGSYVTGQTIHVNGGMIING